MSDFTLIFAGISFVLVVAILTGTILSFIWKK